MDFLRLPRKYLSLPRALRDVATLDIFIGGAAILSVLGATKGDLAIPMGGILCLVIGVGLLRLNPLARRSQIVLVCAAFAGLSLMVAMFFLIPAITGLPLPFPLVPVWMVLALGFAFLLALRLALWELRVLNRPEIRALFGAEAIRLPFLSPQPAALTTIAPTGRVPGRPSRGRIFFRGCPPGRPWRPPRPPCSASG